MTALLAALRLAGGWIWGILRSIPWQAWVLAIAVLAAFLYGNSRGAASRQPEVDQANHLAAEAVASNATLRQTIGTLQAANAEWARKNAADLAAADLAVAAVARERDALRIERDKRRAERETVYAHDPSAAAWGRTVVPRGIADLL